MVTAAKASWLAFFGYAYRPWILTLLAVGELGVDQLPSPPSRKEPLGFLSRVLSGGHRLVPSPFVDARNRRFA
jgi:uncharacterized membrane protein